MTSTHFETSAALAEHPVSRKAQAIRPNREQRYRNVMMWVRKSHGWIGLWGALLGLMFGFSGIWLNHRAVLKLPPFSQQRINGQVALPDPAPASTEEMSAWLQSALNLNRPPNTTRVEPPKPVVWSEKFKQPDAGSERPKAAPDDSAATELAPAEVSPKAPPLMQPEHWVFNFGGANALIQADYWRGNRSVGVTTTSNGLVGTLTNMHKGVGMPVGWILFVDTMAGSLIFLSLSGLLLWLQTNRRRVVGFAIFSVSLIVGLVLVLPRL